MKNKQIVLLVVSALFNALCLVAQDVAVDKESNARLNDERLNLQTGSPWSPRTNLNADVALVYGTDASLPARLDSWRQHGYKVQGMTGVAWGGYQDYLDGHFDGKNHWDEAQKYKDGHMALHGDMPGITPYISPGDSYGLYLFNNIKRVLDAGADAITLEEPEYYADTGWSDNFKRQWKEYYREDWQSPDSSPEAQYRASKLKYYLYRRTLANIFASVKIYAKQRKRTIPCYVATHSLVNYAHWTIVSPESSLIGVGADGFIAQVWTGTARTPNVYEGRQQERTFTSAFLEFGAMQNLARASGRPIWYLSDPVEDDPNHDWTDYRKNWERTLTASLFHPDVWRFEIAPWPDRIFNDKHPLKAGKEYDAKNNAEKVGIPGTYATELQTVMSVLGDMKQADVHWDYSGTQGVGVLVSDTMMFERADPSASDLNLGSFYGLALPPLVHGVPVEPVQIESARSANFLDKYKLLLLTYEGQKPPSPKFHDVLARWVRAGGALVVIDDDRDPYNAVREWWNTPPLSYRTPCQHLFDVLSIPKETPGMYRVGKGTVVFSHESPAALTYRKDGAEVIRNLIRQAAAAVGLPWNETNALVLRRGPYIVAAGLTESIPDSKPYLLRGHFVDLFDPALPVLTAVQLTPGKQVLLIDLDAHSTLSVPRVIASACRIQSEKRSTNEFSFRADGIENTETVIRVRADRKLDSVLVGGKPLAKGSYEMDQGTLRLRFTNSASPIAVRLRFAP
ncbi:MAG: hypothetical protein M3O09_15065 [Acidobacteriota bacterium]|nr:hypothetical protein [Acidobacteriota bacterium]